MQALAAMRQLAHYFPSTEFTIISVNEDVPDQVVWRTFIAQQKMDWVQAWDKNAFLDRDGAVLGVYDGLERLGLVVGQIVRTVTVAPRTP